MLQLVSLLLPLLLLLLLFVLLLLLPTEFVNEQLRCKEHAKSVQKLPSC
jgi:poly-D-alanine transfer protein DltD